MKNRLRNANGAHNRDMTRLDYIVFLLGLGVLFFVGAAYLADSYLVGALFALSGMAVVFAFGKLKQSNKKHPTYANFCRAILLEGKTYSNRYLYLLFPPDDMPQEDRYIVGSDTMVVNALSYGKMGQEAAAKLYRELKRTRPKRLVVAVNEIDRGAMQILGLCADKVSVWRPTKLYRKLLRMGALDEIHYRRTSTEGWWKALRPKHAWLFVLNAVFTVAMSLWLPFKAYYYIFAAINAAMAIGIVVYNRFAE